MGKYVGLDISIELFDSLSKGRKVAVCQVLRMIIVMEANPGYLPVMLSVLAAGFFFKPPALTLDSL